MAHFFPPVKSLEQPPLLPWLDLCLLGNPEPSQVDSEHHHI